MVSVATCTVLNVIEAKCQSSDARVGKDKRLKKKKSNSCETTQGYNDMTNLFIVCFDTAYQAEEGIFESLNSCAPVMMIFRSTCRDQPQTKVAL
mmetsp:Transcript_16732/g.29619  ORF Transcript_16732/g.29619 Transcript_16732/m.29619 type:complete len:94 (-) Transcript_16732:701-982(-)